MFFSVGKEIKDKILAGELITVTHNRSITKNQSVVVKDGKKKKGCC